MAEYRSQIRDSDIGELTYNKRFLEAAEADETVKGAVKAFKAVVKPRKPK